MITRKQLSKNKMLIDVLGIKSGFELDLLMVTDVHRDSKYNNRKLLKKHFDEAKEKDALIFSNGDWFDVMGCYKDPRSQSADVRPEFIHPTRSYLDLIIEESYEFLKPYKKNLLAFGYGNHETAILKYRDTDPLRNLVTILNASPGDDILLSQYFGFLFFKFRHINGGHVRRKNIFHHHGYGGSAKRSKGVLNVDLDAQQWPFADIIFSGHTHQKWCVPELLHTLGKDYEISQKKQYHIKGGSYKDSFSTSMGYEAEKNLTPTPQGGYWIKFKYYSKEIHIEIKEAE